MLERQVIKAELFDEKQTVEIVDPAHPQQRYYLCRNPESAAREGATRQRLLDLTQAGLTRIAGRKKKTAAARLGAQVGRLLARYKMGRARGHCPTECSCSCSCSLLLLCPAVGM